MLRRLVRKPGPPPAMIKNPIRPASARATITPTRVSFIPGPLSANRDDRPERGAGDRVEREPAVVPDENPDDGDRDGTGDAETDGVRVIAGPQPLMGGDPA